VSLPQAAYGAATGGAGDGITSSVGFQYTIGSVAYTPVTNVVSFLHVTDDTCALKEELAAADWAGASAVYQEGSADRCDSPPRLTRWWTQGATGLGVVLSPSSTYPHSFSTPLESSLRSTSRHVSDQ
jgi:hypothetical protein